MSVITKDLGIASAYGYAKSKGYTGTEEEFAELMASYADVAQQAEAAAQDAEDAKDAAITAKTAAQTAQTAAESAQTAASGSAQTASTKATEASNSAQTAAGSATAAGDSATAAADSATTAQTAAQTATTKASEASSSASAASTAKTGAETARTGAQTAQTAAETAQANAEAAASSVSASAAQIEQNTEDITGLKNDLSEFPNGNYPQMGAGYANQLVSGLKKEDSVPYNFRKVPYDATLEEVKKIVGGTIANNQLIDPIASKTVSGVAVTSSNGIFTFSGSAEVGGGRTTPLHRNTINVVTGHKYVVITSFDKTIFAGIYVTLWSDTSQMMTFSNGEKDIKTATFSGSACFGINTITNRAYSESGYFVLCDLTQAFGTAIADYVYNLEQTTAGAGVAWLKTHFPKQFDAGYQAYDAGTLKSIEGLTAHTTVADGVTHTYALDSDVVLRGIPKLDRNNQLYYDGDEYLPDGTVTRKYGLLENQSGAIGDTITLTGAKSDLTDLVSSAGRLADIGTISGTTLTLTKAISGADIIYELAVPTTETADPYTTPQIIAPDGTEEYVYTDGSFELPVGHSSEYPVNVSGQLDDILDTPSANGTYVLKATVTDGAVSYSWVADA